MADRHFAVKFPDVSLWPISSPTCPKKSVLFASGRSAGAKNGQAAGMTLNTAANVAAASGTTHDIL